MHKYILAIMTCLILLKAISADPVKAAENPEQKEMQQRIEQHFRTKAEHFGLKTEGKDLKEVRKRNYYYRRSEEKRECMENSTDASYTNRRKDNG